MAQITVKVPNAALEEVADLLWQSGRPLDPLPPVVDPENPPAPQPPLTAEECIRRWIAREIKGRVHRWRREKAAKSAEAAVDEPVGIE